MHRTAWRTFRALACVTAVSVIPVMGRAQGGLAPQRTGRDGIDRSPRFFMGTETARVPLDVARVPVLARHIALDLDDVSVEEALATIARKAGLDLTYSTNVLSLTAHVRLRVDEITVVAALTDVLVRAGGDVDVVFTRPGKATLVRRPRAQAVGMIAGHVTERGTLAPVASAQVTVVGTGLSRYTDEKGQFRIPNVPAGDHVITVRRLGFEVASQKVRIGDGETATVDIAMSRVATSLTEVVTTATGERSRVEVGNAIGTIKADAVVATSLIRNVSDLLAARTPGVVVLNSSGLVGSPSNIRIRGVASATLSNDPIIILDGIRLTPASNKGLATTIGSTGVSAGAPGFSGGGQRAPARLDDLDPNTIETIDVLRGPSASSLYGTDAAAGVVVIKTKKGAAGPFRFTVLADNGSSYLPGTFPAMWVGYGHLLNGTPTPNCFLAMPNQGAGNVVDHTCIQDSVRAYQPLNDPRLTTLGRGSARNLSANLSGGTEQLREFLSLRVSDATGITKLSAAEQDRIARMWSSPVPSWMKRPNTEQNIDGASRTNVRIGSALDLSFTANMLYRNTLSSGSGTLGDGVNNQTGTGVALGFFDTLIYLPAEAQRARISSIAKRAYGAATANYTPLPWLVLRGTVGGDYTLRTDDALGRASDCTAVLFLAGCPSGHANSRGETYVTTVDLGAQATWAPRNWLSFRTSVGQQYGHTTFYNLTAQNNFGTNLAFGTDLLTPSPVTTTSGAQLYSVAENRDESATAGWYLEETAAVRERLFLTAAFRKDVASAFGSSVNAKAPVYPKFGLSWLVSDESFFPKLPLVSSFRLRSAYGHSGQEARQTAVLNNFVITTAVIDGATVPGMVMSGLGNAGLRPERTAELEGGFDLSLLENERIHLEVTVYRKLSHDAISSGTAPLSFGSRGTNVQQLFSQSVNLGNVENRGWELAATARLLDSRPVTWELTVNATRNINRLVSCIGVIVGIGCSPSTFNQGNFAGYPLNSSFGHRLLGYADVNGDGILAYSEAQFDSQVSFFGTSTPEGELTYLNSLSLWGGSVQVNVNIDQVNGIGKRLGINKSLSGVFSGDLIYRAQVDPTASLADQAAVLQTQTQFNGSGWYSKANTLRVAELSMTWNVPKRLASNLLRARTAAVSLAGRNLAFWTNYAKKDPNVDSSPGSDSGSDFGTNIPQPRSWTFRISLGY